MRVLTALALAIAPCMTLPWHVFPCLDKTRNFCAGVHSLPVMWPVWAPLLPRLPLPPTIPLTPFSFTTSSWLLFRLIHEKMRWGMPSMPSSFMAMCTTLYLPQSILRTTIPSPPNACSPGSKNTIHCTTCPFVPPLHHLLPDLPPPTPSPCHPYPRYLLNPCCHVHPFMHHHKRVTCSCCPLRIILTAPHACIRFTCLLPLDRRCFTYQDRRIAPVVHCKGENPTSSTQQAKRGGGFVLLLHTASPSTPCVYLRQCSLVNGFYGYPGSFFLF